MTTPGEDLDRLTTALHAAGNVLRALALQVGFFTLRSSAALSDQQPDRTPERLEPLRLVAWSSN